LLRKNPQVPIVGELRSTQNNFETQPRGRTNGTQIHFDEAQCGDRADGEIGWRELATGNGFFLRVVQPPDSDSLDKRLRPPVCELRYGPELLAIGPDVFFESRQGHGRAAVATELRRCDNALGVVKRIQPADQRFTLAGEILHAEPTDAA